MVPTSSAPAWLTVYLDELLAAAALHEIPAARLAALVEQESAGNSRAYRYEPAFWTRYLKHRPDYAPPSGAESGGALELWKRRVSASYGLVQVMFATARDHGFPIELAPEALLQPRVNLLLGARILQVHRRRVPDWRGAWLRYNGGARPGYANEVEARVPRFEAWLR